VEARECTKPVIVAIHGKCYTAGIELALAADIVICSEDATFAQAEVRRGIFPLGGATFRMPAIFGWQNAMRWLLTGDGFSASEAHRIGLVQQVVPKPDLLSTATNIAERISSAAPLGVQAVLRNARLARDTGHATASLNLNSEFRKLFSTRDAQEGVASLIEKREAFFVGE
jgi:enoyl-CoA hydratase/carnithine racemase